MRIIPVESDAEPILTPDLVWFGTSGDLVIDRTTGDLQCSQALLTAVLICLQTDCRADPSELPAGETNRGWPGDAFDMQLGDVPLGSKLWLLRRRSTADDVEILAADYAREALQTLIEQGAAVSAEVTATVEAANARLDLDIALYGRHGAAIFNQRFAVLWDQVNGL